jgi:chitinase
MTYDLHGSWDSVTGENSPLYAGIADKTDYQRKLNVVSTGICVQLIFISF